MKRYLFWPLVLSALALLAGCGGAGDSFPTLSPFSPQLGERLHQIRDTVSQIRGLPAYDRITEGTIDKDSLVRYTEEQGRKRSSEDTQTLEAATIALRLLHLVEPDYDLTKSLSRDYTGLILGLYLPKEDRLALVSGDNPQLSIQDELVLVHEYTHSLQDGAFDIAKLAEEWSDSDLEKGGYAQYSETIDCLIEGDATYTARLYAAQVFGPDWRQKVAAEAADGSTSGGPELPEFLARAVSFNYSQCADFVEKLHADGGWDAVNRAYMSPPATTEQILHVEKYVAEELANTTPPEDLTEKLGAGWKRLGPSGQFGEFDVFNYALTLTRDAGLASAAGAGWGAGWSNVYRSDDGNVLVQLYFSWDTDNDLLEFLVVYDAILRSLGAQVQPFDEKSVRWTAEGQFGQISRRDFPAVEILIAPEEATLTQAVK